ncbi:hypothetical protein M431DRAFT_856 [Trichoderma harzianum CBS 226.95]|uniref:Uncharacterized protein n=1 Tax=Trichoderma harzianum CBS 226.95 TaxID=983964 RepID=A0A2T4AUZ0_TRIHA|nr:hypothetical protein M431DRAFT_856 [Trichoderma harzianum CBS 226.95]PTB60883.1 hypothetical protein M431DRAFT_856 [Trichoderma harzianum CBS 226.95]
MWHHRIAKRSTSNCRIMIPLSGNQTALSEDQHEALVDPETLETVRKLIEVIREMESWTEPFRISLRPREEKLLGALKGKAKREAQVELFGKLIQHLHHLVPIETTSRTATVNQVDSS